MTYPALTRRDNPCLSSRNTPGPAQPRRATPASSAVTRSLTTPRHCLAYPQHVSRDTPRRAMPKLDRPHPPRHAVTCLALPAHVRRDVTCLPCQHSPRQSNLDTLSHDKPCLIRHTSTRPNLPGPAAPNPVRRVSPRPSNPCLDIPGRPGPTQPSDTNVSAAPWHTKNSPDPARSAMPRLAQPCPTSPHLVSPTRPCPARTRPAFPCPRHRDLSIPHDGPCHAATRHDQPGLASP